MSHWLVILIAAPLASFGEEPGNARRGTADRPSRSALLGLAGAALGILRADAQGQEALANSFRTATRTLHAGELLSDFHTFQSLPAAKGFVPTRAAALARKDALETTITRRDYRSGALWQAAYRSAGGAISLEDLCDAFKAPHFALWAGRKSCPLAHPLAPLIIADTDVASAFRAHAGTLAPAKTLSGAWQGAIGGGKETIVAIDADLKPQTNQQGWTRRRHDEPGDRLRWHFSPRYEFSWLMAAAEAPKEPTP